MIKKIPKPITKSVKKKIAIIGSGPAGLSCAIELKKMGFDVTVFEKDSLCGMTRLIPDFRLSLDVIRENINFIKVSYR
jgi:glutamate synthase (NADPH/NADH) small chain